MSNETKILIRPASLHLAVHFHVQFNQSGARETTIVHFRNSFHLVSKSKKRQPAPPHLLLMTSLPMHAAWRVSVSLHHTEVLWVTAVNGAVCIQVLVYVLLKYREQESSRGWGCGGGGRNQIQRLTASCGGPNNGPCQKGWRVGSVVQCLKL